MTALFIGVVIEESLNDYKILNQIEISKVHICCNPNTPSTLWHIYTVSVSKEQIEIIAELLKPKGYYANFGNKDEAFVVYPQKIFAVNPHDKSTWSEAIAYGARHGIPSEQLDFSFDSF